jgi:transposase-like protein
MMGHGAKFGRKKEEAIAALLSQRNMEEAARTAGIGIKTLLRWLQLPEFQEAYRDARRAAFSQSIARLQQASSAAAATLLKIMVDPTTPASCRIRAADSVLGHAAKAMEIEDIEARVSELERAAESSKDHRRCA